MRLKQKLNSSLKSVFSMNKHSITTNHYIGGFTLVEMAIVFVIISLLTGTVYVANSMLNNSRLKKVIREVEDIKYANLTFKEQYNAVAGDFSNAYAIWGSTKGCGNSDVNSSSTGCNGNGDGIINSWAAEGLLFWQHLNWTGLIPGKYTGAANIVQPGINSPTSGYPGNSYHVITNTEPSTIHLQSGAYKDADRPVTCIFSPEDAYLIDIKMDDGIANTGSAQIFDSCYLSNGTGWGTDLCTDGSGNYLRTNKDARCRISWYIKY
jgi:Tfp pilus assembly protein PilE